MTFRKIDHDAYRQALATYDEARKRLVALGKTCTTTELETAMARMRAAETNLRLALDTELSCEA